MSSSEMIFDTKKDLGKFISLMKITVVTSRQATGHTLDGGKRPMSFDVYSKMCEIFYKGKNPEYLFAHAFLTIEWNLMARSDNCVNMHINHVQWHEDAMLFFFGKSKGNQGGDRADKPWHVYSNPQMPFLCPVLAMAKYTLTHSDLFHDSCPLFSGLSQYAMFVYIFHNLLNDNAKFFE